MRDGWLEATLGDASELVMGQSPPGSSYNTHAEGLPFIQGSAEFGAHHPTPVKWCNDPRKVAEPGDVLLSVRAPVGDTNVADQRIAIGRGLAIVRGRDGRTVTPYLRLALEHGTDQLMSRSGGGMFASITGAALKALPVALPPLAEQQRIVDLIGSLDETIAAAEDVLLRVRDSAVHIRSEMFHHQEDHVAVGDVYDVIVGKQLQSKATAGELYPYLRAGNIDDGRLDLSIMKEMRFTESEIVRLALKQGDVVIVEGGNGYGKSAIWPGSDGPVALQNHVLRVRPLASPYDTQYAFHWARWCHEQGMFKQTGTGIPNLGVGKVRAMLIPVVNEQTADKIAALVQLQQSEDCCLDELSSLRALRSNLLTALLSGEHEIPATYDELMVGEE